jgi:peptidase C25-like protein
MIIEMNRPWTVVVQDGALQADLEPLIEARRRIGSVRVVSSLGEGLDQADSVLVVGGETPDSAISSAGDGRRVPVGWIGSEREGLRIFVRTAAELVSRLEQDLAPGPAILLAQWDDRALQLADEVERAGELPLLRWSAERLVRRDLLDSLRCGPGVALYLGHALSGGWVGYGGVTAAALTARRMHPLGAILTIACDAAQCNRNRMSFCDELVMRGACSAALGAVGKVSHQVNRVLARSIVRALSKAHTLGELLLRLPDEVLSGYRIAGDPAAPLIGAAHAMETASEVYAPGPDRLVEPVSAARKYLSVTA